MNYTLYDFLKFYSGDNEPLFLASSKDSYDNMYYGACESADYILELLLLHCNNDNRELFNLLKFITNWFNKATLKFNTLIVIGEPNAGKNWIFDSLKCFALSFGTITDLNKSNRFGLQDCVAKRIAVWDEATLDPYFEEQLLAILGGNVTKVPVKHKPAALLPRIPVLITANHDTIPHTTRFNARCVRTRFWRTQPNFFKDKTKLPSPLAWVYIFNMFVNEEHQVFKNDYFYKKYFGMLGIQ